MKTKTKGVIFCGRVGEQTIYVKSVSRKCSRCGYHVSLSLGTLKTIELYKLDPIFVCLHCVKPGEIKNILVGEPQVDEVLKATGRKN